MTSGVPAAREFLSRREALGLAAGGAMLPSLAGCAAGGLRSSMSGHPGADGQAARLTVVVDQHRQGVRIGPGYAGFSYEKSHLSRGFFIASNQPLIRLFRRLGPSLLRIGGNTVDQMTWQDSVMPADVDALATFLRATGWSALYGINLAHNSPDRAAAEAAYVARSLDGHLYGFEIGNEPDAYSFNHDRASSYSYDDFVRQWRIFADAIQRRVPHACLTGPASAWHEQSWTVPFARDEGHRITLLTQHYYRANGLSLGSTLALLLARDSALPGLLEPLAQASLDAGIRDGYRLTEANSFYDGGAPHVSNTYGTALWAIDFLFRNAACRSSGVNFHGGSRAPYTPIVDDNHSVLQIGPEYYGVLLFSMIRTGTLLGTTQSESNLAVSAYAVAGQDRTYVMIVNREPGTSALVTVVPGFQARLARVNRLTAPSLQSTKGIKLNGAPVEADGSWSPTPPMTVAIRNDRSVSLPVGAASAVLLVLM